MTVASIPNIAASFNLSESELYQQALASFLREKKRQVLQARLEIMAATVQTRWQACKP